MTYRTGYFYKEFRQAYSEHRVSLTRMVMFGVFLALVSFAIHFLLQTLYETVLTESIPEFMLPSYFSVLFMYSIVSYIFFLVYFLYFYKYLTFSEIRNNSWYLLVKMGFQPMRMILTKIAVRSLSVIITFGTGFFLAILLTSFLKYPFIPEYFLPVFVSGLIDIIVIITVTLTSSLFIKLFDSARIVIITSAILLFLLKNATGYYRVVSNRTLMRSLIHVFDARLSLYPLIVLLFILVALAVCVFQANHSARFYSPSGNQGMKYAVQDYRTDMILLTTPKPPSKIAKAVNIIVVSLLTLIIVIGIIANVFILVMSMSSPGKEVSINGVIPYVFQSDSMQPAILKNDLAFFQSIDKTDGLKVGDIVLFRERNEVYIERIYKLNESTASVDVDHYPPMSLVGALDKEVSRETIYGVFIARSRWLGALVLFANSFFGRLLMLLIPAVLIFFYKPIMNFFHIFPHTEKASIGLE